MPSIIKKMYHDRPGDGCKFRVKCAPLRVFDECTRGLIELPRFAFWRFTDSIGIVLEHPPAGQVWAEFDDEPRASKETPIGPTMADAMALIANVRMSSASATDVLLALMVLELQAARAERALTGAAQ